MGSAMRHAAGSLAGALLIALVVGGLAASGASAKVTCAEPMDFRTRALAGIPTSPQTGVTYRTSIRTATRYPANPEPILMLVRCEGPEDTQFAQVTPEEPGGGAVRSTFSVRFKRSGRWVVVLMDRGGRFFSVGSFDVGHTPRPMPSGAAAGDVDGGNDVPIPLVVGLGAGMCAVAGAIVVRRRRWRDA